jgi:calcineurin-like phosphoesterase family protein
MSNPSAHLENFTALGGFASVQTEALIEFEGQTFLMSHYPHTGDHGADRYVQYRPADTGMTILHGHTHASEKVSFTDKGTKQIHVGLDAWGLHPVRLATVTAL